MKYLVKDVDRKLESVRKERQEAISIINGLVNKAYNQSNLYNSLIKTNGFVSTRMYGSMASDLAIDSSDVDLSVVGINFNGNRDLMIREMRSFFE